MFPVSAATLSFAPPEPLVGSPNEMLPVSADISVSAQQVIQLANTTQTGYFLTQPIGNHHIITPGNNRKLFEDFMASL